MDDEEDVTVWQGDWCSSLWGVTGTMRIPLHSLFDHGYSTYCDTTYTGWYKKGSSFQIPIDVTYDDQTGTMKMSSQNGSQTVIYYIKELSETSMSGNYESRIPTDRGTFQMTCMGSRPHATVPRTG